jgi:hypothetical protein
LAGGSVNSRLVAKPEVTLGRHLLADEPEFSLEIPASHVIHRSPGLPHPDKSCLSECGFLRLAGMARRTMTQSRWMKTPRCASGRLSPHVFQGNLNHDSQDQKRQHTKQHLLQPCRVTHHARLVTKRGFFVSLGAGDSELHGGINKGALTRTCLRRTCD